MVSQVVPLQRSVPADRRGHYDPLPSQRAPLRAYDRRIEARQPSSLPHLAAGGQTTGILVVDDARTTGPLVYLLHSLGYWATRSASSGATALDLAEDFLPSVVLISLQLPDMSGYRVAAALRARGRGRELRLIALTTDHVHAGRDEAREAGFERYLAKPVGATALHQLLGPQ